MVGWYLLWSTGVVVEGQEERLVDITRKWFERSLLAKKPLVAQRRIGGFRLASASIIPSAVARTVSFVAVIPPRGG